jgi:hypothetical protein
MCCTHKYVNPISARLVNTPHNRGRGGGGAVWLVEQCYNPYKWGNLVLAAAPMKEFRHKEASGLFQEYYTTTRLMWIPIRNYLY